MEQYCFSLLWVQKYGKLSIKILLVLISESFEDFENGGIEFKTGPLKAALLNKISVSQSIIRMCWEEHPKSYWESEVNDNVHISKYHLHWL